MSGFPPSKAAAFPDAFLPFFLGKFFNADGVDVHSVGVDFGGLVVSVVPLDWVGVVGFSRSDGICPVPLGFKVDSSGVPFINCGGHIVHAVDSFHKRCRDSS